MQAFVAKRADCTTVETGFVMVKAKAVLIIQH